LELRAAIDLARLWRDAVSAHDPRALLQSIIAEIDGGEGAKDVRNARALLAEIEWLLLAISFTANGRYRPIAAVQAPSRGDKGSQQLPG